VLNSFFFIVASYLFLSYSLFKNLELYLEEFKNLIFRSRRFRFELCEAVAEGFVLLDTRQARGKFKDKDAGDEKSNF